MTESNGAHWWCGNLASIAHMGWASMCTNALRTQRPVNLINISLNFGNEVFNLQTLYSTGYIVLINNALCWVHSWVNSRQKFYRQNLRWIYSSQGRTKSLVVLIKITGSFCLSNNLILGVKPRGCSRIIFWVCGPRADTLPMSKDFSHWKTAD